MLFSIQNITETNWENFLPDSSPAAGVSSFSLLHFSTRLSKALNTVC